jgi:hypothetical protein
MSREYYNVKLALCAAAFREAWPCAQQSGIIELSAINRRSSASPSQHRLLKTCKLTIPALSRPIMEVSFFRRSQQRPYNQRAVCHYAGLLLCLWKKNKTQTYQENKLLSFVTRINSAGLLSLLYRAIDQDM